MGMRALIFSLMFFSTAAAGQAPDRVAVLRNMASYIGLSEFCVAHGVDYRSLASRMRDGIIEQLRGSPDGEDLEFRRWDRAGQRAVIYNASRNEVVDLVDRIADLRQFCTAAQQYLATLSQAR
jgi:hypothetical protein